MGNYKAYGRNLLTDGEEIILSIGEAKNKKHLREIILNHKNLQNFSKVAFGRKEYSISDIYAGR